ncbi:MAG: hypothetical protein NC318_09520 [Blautia sp.]|nr:hypothetical protein [Lachnoclostridium sp.]MCM1211828.1 hypothetical protein [Blautia sp.]
MKDIKDMKNWWYYHKWYVLCGVIVLAIAGSLLKNALGIGIKKPDVQIAYVGKTPLSTDTVTAIQQAFASIAGDFNNDGEILIQVNQYVDNAAQPDMDAAYYEYGSEISLIGDISNCDSYFFLMDDPDNFQREFQLLANPDGSCPDEKDFSTQDKVFTWADCPVLSTMNLGSYTTVILGETKSGDNQELLSSLFLGRRCFYTEDITDNASQCDDLWNLLAPTN